ncbi:hypothetical protein [Pseudomonas spirodelae]|uniref:Uncharacterized protein n=1 Tax=Pseudomonas spirodelae TaxID=3101751 RepID=A0ABU5P652_9PSED|nr:hypothetical protein [Pseudomonas sp. T5W1]MEA1605038.1 hypothetical protein [Pseudomonas sp. T5W1]
MKMTIPSTHAETSPADSQFNASVLTSPAELLRTAPTKIARVLVHTRYFGDLNRFEAARIVGDTCLNSTIPALETNYGLAYEHIPEKSPNHWGEPCDCTRYRMPTSEYERADQVIERMFKHVKKSSGVVS